jgi:hypothetical protein
VFPGEGSQGRLGFLLKHFHFQAVTKTVVYASQQEFDLSSFS